MALLEVIVFHIYDQISDKACISGPNSMVGTGSTLSHAYCKHPLHNGSGHSAPWSGYKITSHIKVHSPDNKGILIGIDQTSILPFCAGSMSNWCASEGFSFLRHHRFSGYHHTFCIKVNSCWFKLKFLTFYEKHCSYHTIKSHVRKNCLQKMIHIPLYSKFNEK